MLKGLLKNILLRAFYFLSAAVVLFAVISYEYSSAAETGDIISNSVNTCRAHVNIPDKLAFSAIPEILSSGHHKLAILRIRHHNLFKYTGKLKPVIINFNHTNNLLSKYLSPFKLNNSSQACLRI